jgi:ribose-phosphate pyrophosphokinase
MKIISNQQNLKFDVKIFHGGEVNFRFENDLQQRGITDVTIQTQIRSSDDIMALLNATAALREFEVENISLEMYYCPYGRQDRVCNVGEALSIRVFTDLINTQGYKRITVFDPHSEVQTALLHAKVRDSYDFVSEAYHKIPSTEIDGVKQPPIIMSPDGGALKKVGKLAKRLNKPFIAASKDRNVDGGELDQDATVVNGDVKGRNVVVVDDICSGGATFIGLGEKLKELGAEKLYLIVSHAEGEYGLKRVLGTYEHIYTTNSMGELPQIDGVSVYDLFESKE